MGLDMYLGVKDSVEVLYWRKANHIHAWFVDNVQGGVDDCNEYKVSREQLKQLRKLCKQVLKDNKKAPEILPVREGFFFGSSQYDEGYFSDLEHTEKNIKKILKDYDDEIFFYQSSW